jgi:hypothetical protein
MICHNAFKAIAEQHNFPPDFPPPEHDNKSEGEGKDATKESKSITQEFLQSLYDKNLEQPTPRELPKGELGDKSYLLYRRAAKGSMEHTRLQGHEAV